MIAAVPPRKRRLGKLGIESGERERGKGLTLLPSLRRTAPHHLSLPHHVP